MTALETAAANGARYLLNLLISWLEGEGIESVPEPVDLIIWGQAGQAGHGGSAVRARERHERQASVRCSSGDGGDGGDE